MKKIILKVLLFIFFLSISLGIYILTLKGVYGNPKPEDFKNNLDQATKPFELSPERGRYALTMSLVNNHSFSLSQVLADAVYPDVGYYQGRFYTYFVPGISIFAIPLYIVGAKYQLAQVVTFSLSIIFALLTEVVIYKIGRNILKLPIWASIFASLIYAFGSNSWSYAVTLYQHQATAFFLYSSIYAVWLYKKKKWWSVFPAFYVWLCFGLALAIDYPNGLFFAPIICYFFFSSFQLEKLQEKIKITFRPIIIVTSIIFILLVGLHGYYNQVNFGKWYRLSGSLVGYKSIKEQNLLSKTAALQKAAAKKSNVVNFFSEQQTSFGTYTLFVSPDRGLFFYFPIFAISILGFLILIKKKTYESAILLATAAVIVFLYSSWGDPWGGWAFGPRYLIPSFPVFSLAVSLWASEKRYQLLRKIIVFILFLYSSAVALLGVLTTNAVPPKIEGDYLHIGYNYFYNLKFLLDGRTSSFLYNQVFSHNVTLMQYYAFIYAIVVLLAIAVLFVLSGSEKYEY
jgi:hypothetical protein